MKNSSVIIHAVLVAGLSAVIAMGASSVFAQQQGKMEMKGASSEEVTLVGEVLDLYCYMKHPEKGQGPDHAKCAQNCMRKGLPIGFLVDGQVYVITGKGHESAKDLVVEFAGMQSRLTGTLSEHGGVKAIEIEKIEKVN